MLSERNKAFYGLQRGLKHRFLHEGYVKWMILQRKNSQLSTLVMVTSLRKTPAFDVTLESLLSGLSFYLVICCCQQER